MEKEKAYEINANCWYKVITEGIILNNINLSLLIINQLIFTAKRVTIDDLPTCESPITTNFKTLTLNEESKIRIFLLKKIYFSSVI